MSRDDAYLLDIDKAARLIIQFTRDKDRPAFLVDMMTQSAVLHQLRVLGEAVKRLSADFRAGHTQIPWKEIAGMRDRLIHGYDRVDLKEVWRVAQGDVPELVAMIEPLLPNEDPS